MNEELALISAFTSVAAEYLQQRRRSRLERVFFFARAVMVGAFLGYFMNGYEDLNPIIFAIILAHEVSRPLAWLATVLATKLQIRLSLRELL